SADLTYPESLYRDGYTTARPEVYALGTLVLWTCSDKFAFSGSMAEILSRASRIAIANPKLAPYGNETIKVINKLPGAAEIKKKLVFAESISQVNTYITAESVQIGFTSKSTVMAPKMRNRGKWLEVDKKAYAPVAQGVVIMKKSNALQAAERFYR